MAYKAVEIAEYVIQLSNEYGDSITPLKLQKLLYYIQGTYLAIKGEPAFSEEILAWKYGPAVHSVYAKYKEYGREQIQITNEISCINKQDQEIIAEIYQKYRCFTAEQLMKKTHEESPWQNADESQAISLENIREYFSNNVYHDSKLFADKPIVTELTVEEYDPDEDADYINSLIES